MWWEYFDKAIVASSDNPVLFFVLINSDTNNIVDLAAVKSKNNPWIYFQLLGILKVCHCDVERSICENIRSGVNAVQKLLFLAYHHADFWVRNFFAWASVVFIKVIVFDSLLHCADNFFHSYIFTFDL